MRLGAAAEWRTWFKRGGLWWWCPLLVVAGLAWYSCRPTADTLRQLGLVYQLIGVSAVIFEIRKTSKKHNLEPLRERFVSYWQDAPAWRSARALQLSAAESSTDAMSGKGRVSVKPPSGASIEQRLQRLEQLAKALGRNIDAVDQRVDQEQRARLEGFNAEAAQRAREVADLQQRVMEAETGGLHFSMFGVVWLALGVTMSTVPCELRWLPPGCN